MGIKISGVKNFEVSYNDFYGVDLLSPVTKVTRGYSDNAVNCFLNSEGVISSRWSYTSLLQFSGAVTGLFGVMRGNTDRKSVV